MVGFRMDGSVVRGNMRYILLASTIVVFFATFALVSNGFFSVTTTMNIARQGVALALVAIAMTIVMLTGGIDLSVGSSIALSGAVGAIFMRAFPSEHPAVGIAGMLVTIGTAVAIGLLNGYCSGYLGVAPFIVTLATMSLARGLTMVLTDSQSIPITNDAYNSLGQRSLFGVMPWSLLLVVVSFVVAWMLLAQHRFGREVYAIGDNPEAARASGVNVKRQTMLVYVVAGVLVGLAAVIVAGRAQSAQSQAGVGMEFTAITAVVLGGISLFGGQGKLRGTALGVILTAIMFTGLGMLDVKPSVNYLVRGLLIIVAVMSDAVLWEGMRQALRREKQIVQTRAIEHDQANTLTLANISKSFPGVRALDDVSLEIKRGEVHALCGENGAGKSTLMKILSGVYTKDRGQILVDGTPVSITSPVDAQNLGIAVIYQESANIPQLNVTQNVNLGNEIVDSTRIFLNTSAMKRKTARLLEHFNLKINLNTKVERLTVAKQQMIEIAKALGSNAWVVVMDEPTSAIAESDKDTLFKMIHELKERDVAVVYISHRMSEIFEIADVVTVLRDGKHVITGPISEFDENEIVKHMVGRQLDKVFARESPESYGDVVLEVKDLHRAGVFQPISFSVRAGEVLTFAGLVGAGRTEVMRCIFGLDRADGGEIYLNGEQISVRRPHDAISAGIGLVSEDRRREGILPHMSVRENITLPGLGLITRWGFVNGDMEKQIATDYVKLMNIRTPSLEQEIMNLSGGNQQKVCLAKWLSISPKVIVFDEPTRGVDVGAKAEIHQLIGKLTEAGVAIIMISSEMSEVLGASDRIIVLHQGRIAGEFLPSENVSQEDLIRSASGL